jgi:O-antigen ligase
MPQNRVVNHLTIALAFASALPLCAYFNISETLAASALIAFFFALSALSPANGLSFIFLVTPFFLCESSRPFSWMMDAFIYGFLAVWVARRLWEGGLRPPLVWPALFVAIAALVSFPVDFKEFLASFATWRPSMQFYLLRVGWGYPNSLRVTMNILSGVAMYFAVWDTLQKADEKYLPNLLRSAVILAGIYAVAGAVMLHANPMPKREPLSFLGMSLVGVWYTLFTPHITAFAYNPQFCAQWLAPLLPVAVYFAFTDRKNRPWLVVHLISSGLIIYAVLASRQRSAFIIVACLLAAIPAAHVLIRRHERGETPVPPALITWGRIAGYAVGLGVIGIGVSVPLQRVFEHVAGYVNDPMYLSRYGIWEPRFFLWHTALRMAFFHPLTGVGLGRFHQLFFDYFNSGARAFDRVGFATGSAHSMYFQTLSEQGLVGVASWGLFVFGVYRLAFSGFITANRRLITALSFSLAAWLILGIPHDMAYVRSIGIQFWILCAFIVHTAGDRGDGAFPGRRVAMSLLALFAVALALRIGECVARPISKNFAEGFHQWEAQPDGTAARWACGTAVMGVEVAGETMTLELSAPLPGLDKKPQVVQINFDGEKMEVTLNDASWKTVAIHTRAKPGETRLLRIHSERVVNLSEMGGQDDRDLGVMVKPVKWPPNAP